MVKQTFQKLKFNQQLKKSEAGSGNAKTPKAELTISVSGVTIQEPKSKKVLHEYPLHRISYCADDKAEKRFFSFIAKDADSTKHTCFVFLSDKLVSNITPNLLNSPKYPRKSTKYLSRKYSPWSSLEKKLLI